MPKSGISTIGKYKRDESPNHLAFEKQRDLCPGEPQGSREQTMLLKSLGAYTLPLEPSTKVAI